MLRRDDQQAAGDLSTASARDARVHRLMMRLGRRTDMNGGTVTSKSSRMSFALLPLAERLPPRRNLATPRLRVWVNSGQIWFPIHGAHGQFMHLG